MIRFPHAKINIGLSVLGKRPGGYHDIETIMYPVSLTDILEIIPASCDEPTLETAGLEIPDDGRPNLCERAFRILQQDFHIPPVHLYLYKRIPAASGLGGGSSDAAFTLMMLNDLFSLGLSDDQLKAYAVRLGSDCPFFIEGKPSLATGRGDILSPSGLDLSRYYAVIVKPAYSVSTTTAYSLVMPARQEFTLGQRILLPVERWQDLITNDFEAVVCSLYPEAESIKKMLLDSGAVYVSLTGSGSAFFGLFGQEPDLPGRLKECLVWKGPLKDYLGAY
jgi:4-diphosphocytidyl-2-C-methyl-D-erythritol kinase